MFKTFICPSVSNAKLSLWARNIIFCQAEPPLRVGGLVLIVNKPLVSLAFFQEHCVALSEKESKKVPTMNNFSHGDDNCITDLTIELTKAFHLWRIHHKKSLLLLIFFLYLAAKFKRPCQSPHLTLTSKLLQRYFRACVM